MRGWKKQRVGSTINRGILTWKFMELESLFTLIINVKYLTAFPPGCNQNSICLKLNFDLTLSGVPKQQHLSGV